MSSQPKSKLTARSASTNTNRPAHSRNSSLTSLSSSRASSVTIPAGALPSGRKGSSANDTARKGAKKRSAGTATVEPPPAAKKSKPAVAVPVAIEEEGASQGSDDEDSLSTDGKADQGEENEDDEELLGQALTVAGLSQKARKPSKKTVKYRHVYASPF